MKRLVLFLIAFSLFLCANAQIRDTFYGCKLGVTTKKQLLDNLKQLGHECLYDKENKCYYIENVTFVGNSGILVSSNFIKIHCLLLALVFSPTRKMLLMSTIKILKMQEQSMIRLKAK